MSDDQSIEVRRVNSLRGRVRRKGCSLHKSRQRIHGNNLGGFMLVNDHTNCLIAGERYNLTLDDVDDYLNALKLEN